MLIERRPSGFTSDFEENKKAVSEMIQLPSKATRNKIAGHITHRAHRGTSEKVQPEGEGGISRLRRVKDEARRRRDRR
jgi:small subunit ribosomal protein S17e